MYASENNFQHKVQIYSKERCYVLQCFSTINNVHPLTSIYAEEKNDSSWWCPCSEFLFGNIVNMSCWKYQTAPSYHNTIPPLWIYIYYISISKCDHVYNGLAILDLKSSKVMYVFYSHDFAWRKAHSWNYGWINVIVAAIRSCISRTLGFSWDFEAQQFEITKKR